MQNVILIRAYDNAEARKNVINYQGHFFLSLIIMDICRMTTQPTLLLVVKLHRKRCTIYHGTPKETLSEADEELSVCFNSLKPNDAE